MRPPAAARPSLFDWEAWRARTGGADGRTTPKGRPAPKNRPARKGRTAPKNRPQSPEGADDPPASQQPAADRGRWSGRTGVAVLAVAAVCTLLGGFAAFAATLGGPVGGPAPASSIPPGT